MMRYSLSVTQGITWIKLSMAHDFSTYRLEIKLVGPKCLHLDRSFQSYASSLVTSSI